MKTSCKEDLSLAPKSNTRQNVQWNDQDGFQYQVDLPTFPKIIPLQFHYSAFALSTDLVPTPWPLAHQNPHESESHRLSLPRVHESSAPSCLTPEIKTPSLSAPVPDSGAPVPNSQRDLAVACSPCMRWDFRRDGAGRRVPAPQHPPILLQLQNQEAAVRHEEIHLADLALQSKF